MDYKEVVALWRERTRCAEDDTAFCCLVREINALCDAVEALEKDRERMEWLEQSFMGPMDAADLITDWRWNGKRYGGGLRVAIDSAIQIVSAQAPTASTPTPAAPSDA